MSSPSKRPQPYGISLGSIQCLTSWGLARLSMSRSCILFRDTRSLVDKVLCLERETKVFTITEKAPTRLGSLSKDTEHRVLIMGYGYLIHISMENIIVNKLAPISTGPVEIFYLDYLYIWTRKSRENETSWKWMSVTESDSHWQWHVAWSQGQLHS